MRLCQIPILRHCLYLYLYLCLALLATGCLPSLPSFADPSDPWVAVDPESGRSRFDPEGLPDLDLDPRAYRVTWVSDGDTIKLDMAGRIETVRLLGINTPETVDPRRPVQCYGREASAFMRDLVEDRRVRIATDPSQDRYDRHGRLLAYVWLPDGGFVNLEMLRGGYAGEYTYDRPYAFRDIFRAAAREAERSGRGLWAADTCAGDFSAPALDFSKREGRAPRIDDGERETPSRAG
jgi:micrococcal nuclease